MQVVAYKADLLSPNQTRTYICLGITINKLIIKLKDRIGKMPLDMLVFTALADKAEIELPHELFFDKSEINLAEATARAIELKKAEAMLARLGLVMMPDGEQTEPSLEQQVKMIQKNSKKLVWKKNTEINASVKKYILGKA